jgi:protein dithiol:quinone oxidoreductase
MIKKLPYALLTLCLLMLAWAYYLQYVEEMEPCPLCYFQRVVIIAFAVILAVNAWLKPWLSASLLALFSLTGIGIAGRHIYIQNLPADQVPACGQGITYMLESLPLLDVFAKVLKGSGECAKRDLFLGLTLPTWTLLFFIGMLLYSVTTLWSHSRQSQA